MARGSLGVADSVIDPPGHIALCGHHVELCQPPMFHGPRRLDELLGPRDGLELFDPITEEFRVYGDGGRGVEVTVVGGPPEGGAQVGQLDGEPGIGLDVAGDCPTGQARRLRGLRSNGRARSRAPRPRPVATSCSSANWRIVSNIENRVRPDERSATTSDLRTKAIEQVQRGEIVAGAGHRAGAGQVETAGEHRTPCQQVLFGVVEQVVRPLHSMAQGMVALQPTPDPTSSRNRSSSRSRTSATVMDCIREAANSIASGIPSRRRQISTTASPRPASEMPGATAWARSTNNVAALESTLRRPAMEPARVVRR